ncbi:hypothetical protein SBA1_360036 [Candidatus Sulfotelmatobacter kueseliae]|uniref:Uncharacterized protein n=1 Tax=Candidatus Sulfotelmatobacter kueseliae TaxID=2042962 RepID=A0A2U3KPC3_9BACT|nr:hypothetical protein SBA1_360036 [Candidatus Sulfotelmatobacter kueseliae]
MKLLLHRRESGPGGIRTRICYLDRVLCCRYTTGPEWSFCRGLGVRKDTGHNLILGVPDRDELTVGRFTIRAHARSDSATLHARSLAPLVKARGFGMTHTEKQGRRPRLGLRGFLICL